VAGDGDGDGDGSVRGSLCSGDDGSPLGLVPRCIAALIGGVQGVRHARACSLSLAAVEVYARQLNDLVPQVPPPGTAPSSWPPSVPMPGVSSVERLHWHHVLTPASGGEGADGMEAAMGAAQRALAVAQANRTTAATRGNAESSRSHAIYFVRLVSVGVDACKRTGTLAIVDLAGSESLDPTPTGTLAATGVGAGVPASGVGAGSASPFDSPLGGHVRDVETRTINTSLHVLTKVVAAYANCAPGATPAHVPYREALLTTLLRESIGGNSVTSFVLALADGDGDQLAHSLKTCTFGSLLRAVHNRARPNVEFDPTAAMDDLRAQVASLSAEVASLEKRTTLQALVDLCQAEVDAALAPTAGATAVPEPPGDGHPVWAALDSWMEGAVAAADTPADHLVDGAPAPAVTTVAVGQVRRLAAFARALRSYLRSMDTSLVPSTPPKKPAMATVGTVMTPPSPPSPPPTPPPPRVTADATQVTSPGLLAGEGHAAAVHALSCRRCRLVTWAESTPGVAARPRLPVATAAASAGGGTDGGRPLPLPRDSSCRWQHADSDGNWVDYAPAVAHAISAVLRQDASVPPASVLTVGVDGKPHFVHATGMTDLWAGAQVPPSSARSTAAMPASCCDGTPAYQRSVIDTQRCMEVCLATGRERAMRRVTVVAARGLLWKRSKWGGWVLRHFVLTPQGLWQAAAAPRDDMPAGDASPAAPPYKLRIPFVTPLACSSSLHGWGGRGILCTYRTPLVAAGDDGERATAASSTGPAHTMLLASSADEAARWVALLNAAAGGTLDTCCEHQLAVCHLQPPTAATPAVEPLLEEGDGGRDVHDDAPAGAAWTPAQTLSAPAAVASQWVAVVGAAAATGLGEPAVTVSHAAAGGRGLEAMVSLAAHWRDRLGVGSTETTVFVPARHTAIAEAWWTAAHAGSGLMRMHATERQGDVIAAVSAALPWLQSARRSVGGLQLTADAQVILVGEFVVLTPNSGGPASDASIWSLRRLHAVRMLLGSQAVEWRRANPGAALSSAAVPPPRAGAAAGVGWSSRRVLR